MVWDGMGWDGMVWYSNTLNIHSYNTRSLKDITLSLSLFLILVLNLPCKSYRHCISIF
ncbi:hypothetical protein BofuT4_P018000.1 [Botrytis cinerea T4]|uniref:Uncharacterized protein n=1 Tax=Botryotinia fuckeliana (strain T4) TaxID=999810 RepID=G2YIF7_BOTF4|nr:hypothetical protein BofuT4_P018000.1 [Botrytis cinerea T4]